MTNVIQDDELLAIVYEDEIESDLDSLELIATIEGIEYGNSSSGNGRKIRGSISSPISFSTSTSLSFLDSVSDEVFYLQPAVGPTPVMDEDNFPDSKSDGVEITIKSLGTINIVAGGKLLLNDDYTIGPGGLFKLSSNGDGTFSEAGNNGL